MIVPALDEGLGYLGYSAYLVHLMRGRALTVAVQRDLRAVRTAADRHGLRAVFTPARRLRAMSAPLTEGTSLFSRSLAATRTAGPAVGERSWGQAGLTAWTRSTVPALSRSVSTT